MGFKKKTYPVSNRVHWKDLRIGDWVKVGRMMLYVSGFRDSGIDGIRPQFHGFTFDPSEITEVSRHI